MNNLVFCSDQDVHDMNFDLVVQIDTKLFQKTINNAQICGLYVKKLGDNIMLSFCSTDCSKEIEHIINIPVFNFDTDKNLLAALYISNQLAVDAQKLEDNSILFQKGISRHINIINNQDPKKDFFHLYISKDYPLCIKYSLGKDSYTKLCLHPFEFKNK